MRELNFAKKYYYWVTEPDFIGYGSRTPLGAPSPLFWGAVTRGHRIMRDDPTERMLDITKSLFEHDAHRALHVATLCRRDVYVDVIWPDGEIWTPTALKDNLVGAGYDGKDADDQTAG